MKVEQGFCWCRVHLCAGAGREVHADAPFQTQGSPSGSLAWGYLWLPTHLSFLSSKSPHEAQPCIRVRQEMLPICFLQFPGVN